MKMGPAELAQWKCWETERNRMTEGQMRGVKERKMVRGVESQRIKQ